MPVSTSYFHFEHQITKNEKTYVSLSIHINENSI